MNKSPIRQELDEIRQAGLNRVMREVEGVPDARVRLDGRDVVNFGSNNYLGLAGHPALREAAAKAARDLGAGATASRLVCGTLTIHVELERRLAAFERTESAILFNSGYCANLGVVTSLVGRGDAVFGDRLNHASLVDGCRLSGAKFVRYAHADADDLDRRLGGASTARRRLVVTDSVFSVDGDVAPLAEIAEVCDRRDAWLVVDEAHATGVFGPGGRGLVEQLGLEGRALVMGTLSKAVGSAGGYVASDAEFVELLRNRARSFIYTTALPPAMCAASLAGLEIIEKEPERRRRLWDNVVALRTGLTRLRRDMGRSAGPIIPVMAGAPQAAMDLAARLLDAGVFAPAMRPPTVPAGQCRLRLSAMATHTDEDIRRLVEALGTAEDQPAHPART